MFASAVAAARPLASLRGNVSISSPTLSLSLHFRSLFSPPSLPIAEARGTLLGWSGPQRDAPTALTLPPRLDGRAGKPLSFPPPSPTDRPSRPLPTPPPLRSLPARALTSSPQPSAERDDNGGGGGDAKRGGLPFRQRSLVRSLGRASVPHTHSPFPALSLPLLRSSPSLGPGRRSRGRASEPRVLLTLLR